MSNISELRPCPECVDGEVWLEDGTGGTCGVCLGDAYLYREPNRHPNAVSYVDHSWHGHSCRRCERTEVGT